jgi:hypothetical protein
MIATLAYALHYNAIIVVATLLAWLIAMALRRSLAQRLWFRAIPVAAVAFGVGKALFGPSLVAKPAGPLTFGPGQTATLDVTLEPAYLAALYPFVTVEPPRCRTCDDPAPGFVIEGRVSGSRSTFTIKAPKDRPDGVLYTRATASVREGDRPSVASAYVELRIE